MVRRNGWSVGERVNPALFASVIGGGDWSEAEARVKIFHHRVPCSRPVAADQGFGSRRMNLRRHDGEQRMLDATAEHAAAHEPGIDFRGLAIATAREAHDYDACEAVIAEAVGDSSGERQGAGVSH